MKPSKIELFIIVILSLPTLALVCYVFYGVVATEIGFWSAM